MSSFLQYVIWSFEIKYEWICQQKLLLKIGTVWTFINEVVISEIYLYHDVISARGTYVW